MKPPVEAPSMLVERCFLGLVLPALPLWLGASGICSGKVFVFSRTIRISSGAGDWFYGQPRLFAAASYILIAALLHYACFWCLPRQKPVTAKPVAIILLALLIGTLFAFVYSVVVEN